MHAHSRLSLRVDTLRLDSGIIDRRLDAIAGVHADLDDNHRRADRKRPRPAFTAALAPGDRHRAGLAEDAGALVAGQQRDGATYAHRARG